MDQTSYLKVEVAFATKEKQTVITLQVKPHTNIFDIIKMSKIHELYPKFEISNMPVGIFGKKIDIHTYQIRDGDRIEIYRPLNKTPNQKRLERAKAHEKETNLP